jgi:hypothetical protein
MTTNETCPHCGAEIFDKADNYTVFKCVSIVWNNGSSFIQRDCLKNQIAAQAAEIERLRKELSRIYVHSGDGTNGECEYCNWSSDTAFHALKEVK